MQVYMRATFALQGTFYLSPPVTYRSTEDLVFLLSQTDQ